MKTLDAYADERHRRFFSRLVPGLPVLGVKKAGIQAFLDSLDPGQQEAFLDSLPHEYVEENQAHMYLLNRIPDRNAALRRLEQFLPYIDNWSVSDILNPRALGPDPETEAYALKLLKRPDPYAARCGMLILKRHFLPARPHLKEVLQADTSAYPLSMMVAWYLAEYAIHDPGQVLSLLGRLDVPTRRRTIQKVIDSRRIPPEMKERFRQARPRG